MLVMCVGFWWLRLTRCRETMSEENSVGSKQELTGNLRLFN